MLNRELSEKRTDGDQADGIARELTIKVLADIAHSRELRRVNVRLWDGSHWPDAGQREATIILTRPSSLREMLLEGTEVALGRGVCPRRLQRRGRHGGGVRVGRPHRRADRGLVKKAQAWLSPAPVARIQRRAMRRCNARNSAAPRHSTRRDRAAIGFHYDVSNEFYQLWLDPAMAYSCAYFSQPEQSLEEAQRNKFRHICRKLDLQAGPAPARHRLRLGRPAYPCSPEPRRDRRGDHAEPKPAGAGPGTHPRRRPAGQRERTPARLPGACRSATPSTPWSAWGWSSTLDERCCPEYFQQAHRVLKPGRPVPQSRDRPRSASSAGAQRFLHPAICLPRYRPDVDRRHAQLCRGRAMGRARRGKPARALCAHAAPLGQATGSEPCRGGAAGGRADLSCLAALHERLRLWVPSRATEHLPVAAGQAAA